MHHPRPPIAACLSGFFYGVESRYHQPTCICIRIQSRLACQAVHRQPASSPMFNCSCSLSSACQGTPSVPSTPVHPNRISSCSGVDRAVMDWGLLWPHRGSPTKGCHAIGIVGGVSDATWVQPSFENPQASRICVLNLYAFYLSQSVSPAFWSCVTGASQENNRLHWLRWSRGGSSGIALIGID